MKKFVIVVLIFCLVLAFLLVGCNLLDGSDDKEYKIIFVGTSIPSITVTDGGAITMPQDPISDGYIFGGWFVDSACTIPFNQQYLDAHPLNADLRIYPKWVEEGDDTITLTLDVNGGNELSDDTVEIVAGINTVQYLPIPTRGGYNFVGWYTAKIDGDLIAGDDGIVLNYQGDSITLYAVWEESTYYVVLSEVDDSIGTVSGGKSGVSYLEQITVTATTVDSNYNFIGWYNGDELASDSMTYTFSVSEDVTLTAKWLGEERTIKFYRNHTESDEEYVTVTYNYGSDVEYIPEKLMGHSFIGWYDNTEGVGEAISDNGVLTNAKFADGISLYASWTEGYDQLFYNITSATEVEVVGIKSTAGSVVYIPTTWGDYKVTSIAANTFKNSTKSAIVIPSSIATIGTDAFKDATAKIYFDRGAKLSLLTTDNFSASQSIYSHLVNESENALLDGCYVEANGIFADDYIDTVQEAKAFYSYVWLYTYTDKVTLTISSSVYDGNDTGFKDAMMGDGGLFKNIAKSLMLKSDTAQAFTYNTIDNKRQIYFNFDKKTSNFVASATTNGGMQQVQAKSLTQVSNTGSEHEFYIDSMPEYLVFNSEQLVYAVEHGYKPIFGAGSTSAEACYNSARSILSTIVSENMTEVDKIKAIHDYIALNVTYDSVLLGLSTSNSAELISHYRGFSLEGVFQDKKAVCDGITKSFMLMCRIEGIEAIRVSGTVNNNGLDIGHAWNKVEVDGVWYVIDVTNDDSMLSIGGVSQTFELLTHKFFMVSDSSISATHTEDADNNAPVATGTYDYFKTTKYDGVNDLVIKSQTELNLIINEVKNMKNLTDIFYYAEVKFETVNPENLDYSVLAGYSYLPYESGSKAHYSIGNGVYLLNFLVK